MNANLMNVPNIELQRFASTVLDMMQFTKGKVHQMNLQMGNYVGKTSESLGKDDIDYIHKKFEADIYDKHLAKPFMTESELNDYLFRETLKKDRASFDLLMNNTKKDFNITL